LTPRPYTIGFLTVVLLVALRVVIGWHFFQEGLSHQRDPHWSSEGFLRQAKGPLSKYFKTWTPEFHQWDRLLAVPMEPGPMALPSEGNPAGDMKEAGQKAVVPETAKTLPNEGDPQGGGTAPKLQRPAESGTFGKWYQQIVYDWSQHLHDLANYYHFSDEQNRDSHRVLAHYRDKLGELLRENETDIAAYRHQLYRNTEIAGQPGAEQIPYEKARLARREQNPTGEQGISVGSSPAEWRGDVEALEQNWVADMLAMRTAEQLKLGAMPDIKSDLKRIDTAITWLLIVGGGLLVVGLFTRLSAAVLALFLLAVMATQPPWIAGTVETYYQGVEFVALLALATSPVGRWAGLDFFVHHVLLRPFRRAERSATFIASRSP
jgi:uncharacterized membrane protein YphA (DoxX/SURF4 family)